MDLKNKAVLLTGASSGIGYSLAHHLAKEGCKLALIARRQNLLNKLSGDISSDNLVTFQCDVGKREQVNEIFGKVRDHFGKIDIAILNAGVSGRTALKSYNGNQAKEIFDTNSLSIVYAIEQLLPDFMERKDGMIVGISSLADVRGFPKSGFYNASKAAATILLESLRIELKPFNVKVITVKPGFVRTPMTDKNEFHMPFMIDVDNASEIILAGIKNEKRVIEFPLPTVLATKLIKILPNFLFDKLAGRKLPDRKDKVITG
ncbi:MAG: SDR family NAD(P)-dependent oxidoreductase [Ignavibacteriaceae bacterium]|nr:SDR family NAD(P)-dependent oxidoreductase [Ignavibacteriaceae bacterium]